MINIFKVEPFDTNLLPEDCKKIIGEVENCGILHNFIWITACNYGQPPYMNTRLRFTLYKGRPILVADIFCKNYKEFIQRKGEISVKEYNITNLLTGKYSCHYLYDDAVKELINLIKEVEAK